MILYEVTPSPDKARSSDFAGNLREGRRFRIMSAANERES